jgi:tRNA threonylcarbamoyladenosine biosynthesis protein TsaE
MVMRQRLPPLSVPICVHLCSSVVKQTDHLTYEAADEAATAALGAALADVLSDGTVVALCGTLGSGKTRLVQAIAEASGVDCRDVASPTFVLVREYQGRQPIYHLDAYRLRSEEEFLQLGPDEYFEAGGLALVEWADRVEGCLPPERIEIRIEVTGTHSRRFEIIAVGERYREVIARLRDRLKDEG